LNARSWPIPADRCFHLGFQPRVTQEHLPSPTDG